MKGTIVFIHKAHLVKCNTIYYIFSWFYKRWFDLRLPMLPLVLKYVTVVPTAAVVMDWIGLYDLWGKETKTEFALIKERHET